MMQLEEAIELIKHKTNSKSEKQIYIKIYKLDEFY